MTTGYYPGYSWRAARAPLLPVAVRGRGGPPVDAQGRGEAAPPLSPPVAPRPGPGGRPWGKGAESTPGLRVLAVLPGWVIRFGGKLSASRHLAGSPACVALRYCLGKLSGRSVGACARAGGGASPASQGQGSAALSCPCRFVDVPLARSLKWRLCFRVPGAAPGCRLLGSTLMAQSLSGRPGPGKWSGPSGGSAGPASPL